MMMVNIATKKMKCQMKAAKVRKMRKTLSMGDVADSPVGPMEPLAARKRGPYFTEADDKDETAMCQVPQLALCLHY